MAARKETPNKKIKTVSSAPEARVLSREDVGLVKPTCKPNAPAFARWVRVLHQNWRQGTVGCKGRSDVARSGRKPFKQKGTGRARAGDSASPLWKGGGVVFGPQARERSIKLPQGQRKHVMRSLIGQFLDEGRVRVLSWTPEESPKTSHAFNALKEIGVLGKRIVLLVGVGDALTARSFRNIAGVRIALFDQPNAVNLGTSQAWVVLEKDIESFKAMVP